MYGAQSAHDTHFDRILYKSGQKSIDRLKVFPLSLCMTDIVYETYALCIMKRGDAVC